MKIVLVVGLVGLLAVVGLVFFLRAKIRGFFTKVATSMASAMQPATIELVRQQQLGWLDRAKVGQNVSQLRTLGFKPIGNFTIRELPNTHLVALGHPEEGFGAAVYEFQDSGKIFCEMVAIYHQNSSLAVGNAAPSGMEQPPFAPKIYIKNAPPKKLYKALCEAVSPEPLVAVTPKSFKQIFENSWKHEQAWRIDHPDGEEPPDPLGHFPLADESHAERLGFNAEVFHWLVQQLPESLRLQTLNSWAERGTLTAADFPGTIQPDPEDENAERLVLETLAVSVPASQVGHLAKELRKRLSPRGIQCLRVGDSIVRGKSVIAFLVHPNAEPFLWAFQTNGANFDVDTSHILAWLRKWQPLCGLQVIGAGFDWLEVEIETLTTDPRPFTEETVRLCPDLVEGLLHQLGDEEWDEEDDERMEERAAAAMVDSFRHGERELHLWWD